MIPTSGTPQPLRSGMASSRRNTQKRWLNGLLAGQFRRLLEYLPGTLFFAKDAEGRLMRANPVFAHRCGLSSEDELITTTCSRPD
jgi:hypothetical protein